MGALEGRVKLWPHQIAALQVAQSYLRAHSTARGTARAPRGAGLINIPTGGGKTAVIALLAHEGPNVGRALVFAPRTGIRDQLCEELAAIRAKGFFVKQRIGPQDLKRPVYKLETASHIQTAPAGPAIFLSTIQLFDQLRSNDQKQFEKFAKTISLVLVDEGHYEPARSWSKTIRGFQKPTVLFTATPYRNDLLSFEIEPTAIHVTRFVDLAKDRFIRDVKVVPASYDGAPGSFISTVLRIFKKELGGPPSESQKLIVRCDRKEDVVKICEALRHRGLTVIGLHERFSQRETKIDPWKQRKPPDPEGKDAAAVWVHQHKLLEGVDGPSFRAVAMFGPLGSVRALIQQIGRIIRNTGRASGQVALVFDHSKGQVTRNWKRYQRYDAMLTAKDLQRGAQKIVQEALLTLPELDYIEETFRERFDLGMAFDADNAIKLPTSAHFLELRSSFQFQGLLDGIKRDLEERALSAQHIKLSLDRHLFIYIAWRNSPLLAEHYFVELTLHAVVVKKFKEYIAYLDTGGGIPLSADELEVEGPIRRDRLARVFPRAAQARITSVSTRNAILGPKSVRARLVSAPSVDETVPFMDDFQHLPMSLTGVVRDVWIPSVLEEAEKVGYKPRVRRYIGFGRGYISDLGPRVRLGEYFEWLEAAEERLTGRRQAVGLLDRYARVVSGIPEAPDARNILLDLDEARLNYQLLDDGGSRTREHLDLDDACADCTSAPAGQPRNFTVSGHGRTFTGTVHFDRIVRKYIIESPELSSAFQSTATDRPGMDLVTFLNRQQAFLVLPDTQNLIYAEGAFFAPEIGTGDDFDPDRFAVGHVLEGHAALEKLISEKGNKADLPATQAGWHANSVFGWFDRNLDKLFKDPDLVICDDMGTESADFIVLDNDEQRIVLVHCKARKKPALYGATALQEVSGQAKKNCGTLNLFKPLRPPNCTRWHEPWESHWVKGKVKERVRRGNAGAKQTEYGERIWERLETCIRNPNVEREVWLVLGATLKKSALESALKKARPEPEAIQTTYLLQSTLAAIGGANARLKVLCGP